MEIFKWFLWVWVSLMGLTSFSFFIWMFFCKNPAEEAHRLVTEAGSLAVCGIFGLLLIQTLGLN